MAAPIFLTPDPTIPPYQIAAVVFIAVVALILILPRKKTILIYGWGRVYVLRDARTPNLFKVGMTRRPVKTRMSEVAETMAGGAQLEQVYSVKVPYVANVEAFAHLALKRHRYWSERGTEWFDTDQRTAIGAVDHAARRVRKIARRQRKWSDQADRDSSRWRLTRNGPVIERLFGRW